MSLKKMPYLCTILLLSAALAGCSDDAPSERNEDVNPDTTSQSDAGGDDGTSPDDTQDPDGDDTGECSADEDCTFGAHQLGVCDTATNTCISSCEEGFDDCDGDATNGCEIDLTDDIDNCGTCGNACELTSLQFQPICDDEGQAPTCDVDPDTCADGYVDADDEPGCECEVTDAADPIDGTDTNCDGVDGVLEDSVFVTADGGVDTTYDGLTPELPLGSIEEALQVAADAGRSQLLVAGGDYEGSISLENGISIYGGFSADDGFAGPVETETTTILAADADFDANTLAYITVQADAIADPTTLAHLTIVGFEAANPGASTLALRTVDSPGLVVQNTVIEGATAGAGSEGIEGADPSCTPAEGGDGGIADGTERPCDDPGFDGDNASRGLSGELASSPNGIGGDGGLHHCGVTGSATSGEDGANGTQGDTGDAGTLPTDGALGSFDATGVWTPAAGTEPTDGTKGGGGGGGGAGGNHQTSTTFKKGGNGGNGGDGGCAGKAATNGQPGGSSFGIVVIGDAITLTDTTIELGAGGIGGDGGVGSAGDDGSSPSNDDLNADGARAGAGGRGAFGGPGGNGGNGVGGQGGNAIGVATFDATVATDSVTFDGGVSAAGGQASAPAEDGRDGVVAQQQDFSTTD